MAKKSNLSKSKQNRLNSDNFLISFFELMFLAEAVIPDTTIARSVCFDNFSEIHYHTMTPEQRVHFLKHVQNCYGFDLKNKQCLHFHARFNPKNQFIATCEFNNQVQKVHCYMHEGEYKISMNKLINRDYIKSIVRIYDGQVIL